MITNMTAAQLREYMNTTYGNSFERWPPTLEVDAVTYANVFQEMVKWCLRNHQYIMAPGSHYELSSICVGITNNGLMFKGVELLLK